MRTLSAWQMCCSVLGMSLLLLALLVVWLNLTLVGLSYEIEGLQKEIAEETGLNDKLRLEQLHLVSAQNMGLLLQRFELQKPDTDSIRKIRD